MSKPKRIQRRRTKGWRMPPNTVYVGRPTKWGNPYIIGTQMVKLVGLDPNAPREPLTAEEAVHCFRGDMNDWMRDIAREELRGKNLACWCPLDQPCHAEVLLGIANS